MSFSLRNSGIRYTPFTQFTGNQGQILLNPDYLETSGGYEFLNLMKHAQLPWVYGDTSGPHLDPTQVDSDGYPTAIPVGQSDVYTVIYIPNSSERPGETLHVTWDDNGAGNTGSIDIAGGVLISGSRTASGGHGFAEFSNPITNFGPIQFKITATPVTNLKLFFSGDASDMTAGFITGSKFRQRISQAKTPVFRMLTWLGGAFTGANFPNLANWRDQKPATYCSYAGGEQRLSLWGGTTTNSGNDYSITPGVGYTPGGGYSGGAPVDKQQLILIFNTNQTDNTGTSVSISVASPGVVSGWTGSSTALSVGDPIMFVSNFGGPTNVPAPMNMFVPYYVHSFTGTDQFTLSFTPGGPVINTTSGTSTGLAAARLPTLNLNGTGAVPIVDQGGGPQTGPVLYNNLITGVVTYGLIYDASLNLWYQCGGQTGLEAGVPISVFVQMCKEIGAHPWFCSPIFACDPMTDWHNQLATYMRTSAPSWMVPRFECINEPWNYATLAGAYGAAKSFVNWGVLNQGDDVNFTGKVVSTIGQDITNVYGAPTGTAYHLIANINTFPTPTAWDDMMNSTLYTAQGSFQGTTSWNPSGYNGTPASHFLTHVTINQYFQSAENYDNAATAWYQSYANPTTQQAVVDVYLSGSGSAGGFTGTGNGMPAALSSLSTTNSAVYSWAQGFTNNAGAKVRMCGYEGGANSQSFGVSLNVDIPTNGTTTAGSAVLDFHTAGTPSWMQTGLSVTDLTSAVIPSNTTVLSFNSTTVTLSNNVTGGGVGNGDTIQFTVPDNLQFWDVCMNTGTNLQSYCTTAWQQFITAGGEHPALFQMCGPLFHQSIPGVQVFRDNVWSCLIDVYQTPDPPEWLAVLSFNH